MGFQQSRIDNCLFIFIDPAGKTVILYSIHVDDSGGWCHTEYTEWLQVTLSAKLNVRYFQIIFMGVPSDFLGQTWLEKEAGCYISQEKFIKKKLQLIPKKNYDLPKGVEFIPVGCELYDLYRNRLGGLIWVERTRPEIAFDVSILASSLSILTYKHIEHINSVIAYLFSTSEYCLFLPRLPLDEPVVVRGLTDASLNARPDESSQGARAIGLGTRTSDIFAPVEFCSKKTRRKGCSSFDVECINCVDCVDMSLVVALLWEEFVSGPRPSLTQRNCFRMFGMDYDPPRIPVIIDTDANDIVTRVYSLKRSLDISKRRRLDIADLQECLQFQEVEEYRHIAGPTNPVDVGTKSIARHKIQYRRYLKMMYAGEYSPDMPSSSASKQVCHFSNIQRF
jgi:hypothetical protein